jgi:hypothetical protein
LAGHDRQDRQLGHVNAIAIFAGTTPRRRSIEA